MAVQRLNYRASYLLQQALGGTAASPPNVVSSRSPGLLHRGQGREPSVTSILERLSAEGECHEGSDRPRHGSAYLVNPSRYPPSHRFTVTLATTLSHQTPVSRNRPHVSHHTTTNDHKPSLLQEHRTFPHSQVLPTAALQSWPQLPSPSTSTLSLPQQQIPNLLLHPALLGERVPSLATLFTFSPSPTLSSSPTSHSPQPPSLDDKPTPSQLAFVLLKLREELPTFFTGHHTMELYAKNMIFENSLGPKAWTVQGLAAYLLVLAVWRAAVKAFLSETRLELLKITKNPDEGKIEARWRACGKPRAPWTTRERVILEAFSTFSVNSEGDIVVHKMDKVMPGGKEHNRVMSWLAWVGVALTPSPQHSVEATRTPDNDFIHI